MCVQFDRSNSRNKAAADQILCGLEEVLANLQPSNSFVDESMLRYRVSSWILSLEVGSQLPFQLLRREFRGTNFWLVSRRDASRMHPRLHRPPRRSSHRHRRPPQLRPVPPLASGVLASSTGPGSARCSPMRWTVIRPTRASTAPPCTPAKRSAFPVREDSARRCNRIWND